MKPLIIGCAIVGGLIGSQLAWSTDMEAGKALAKKSGCLNCHAETSKVVGPSYADVAKKYKDDGTASAKLEKKVADGGSGVWGSIPMPSQKGKISEADIKALVEWVLAH